MRALVIEDERGLAESIARGLQQAGGFAVNIALDGEDGLLRGSSLLRSYRSRFDATQAGWRGSSQSVAKNGVVMPCPRLDCKKKVRAILFGCSMRDPTTTLQNLSIRSILLGFATAYFH